MRARHIVILVAVTLAVACDTPFDPKGPYEETLVVYAVLSTETDTTYARVYRTYNPEGYDPNEITADNPVTDALVRLSSNGSEWTFGDTLVARDDTSRYKGPINAYVLTGVHVTPGAEYRLDVSSPTAGSADAVVAVPGTGYLQIGNSFVLQNPTLTLDNVIATVTLSPTTWGYTVRLYLIGEEWVGGSWRSFEREVPLSVVEIVDCEHFAGEFPRLSRREGTSAYEDHILIFENIAYRYTIASIRSGRPVDSVRFLRAEFDLLETDRHLYSYYNIAAGFRDEFTLRTDEPDYSNIRGGRGVFGAFVRQRISFDVPANLGGSLTCK